MTPDHEEFLRRAIALARTSRDAGQAPYGSLLVGPDDRVLAEDPNKVLTTGTSPPSRAEAGPVVGT